MRILITPVAQRSVRDRIQAAGPNETGDALLGWRRSDLGLIVVADATGPGRRAVQRPRRLRLDTIDLQRHIDDAFAASDGHVQFLGDWHLHHEAIPHPSRRDVMSLAELADDRTTKMVDPILVIVGRAPTTANLSWLAWLGPTAQSVLVDLIGEAQRGD